jgi:hypothetical protein
VGVSEGPGTTCEYLAIGRALTHKTESLARFGSFAFPPLSGALFAYRLSPKLSARFGKPGFANQVSVLSKNNQERAMKNYKTWMALLLLSGLFLVTSAFAQLTPTGDAYTNTVDPTTNYGSKTVLDVESVSQTTYIQFNLSSIPSGYTGGNISQATLKLYVNAVTKGGSFNVDYVNGSWSESTIDANNAPALGSTIAASVPLTAAEKNQYILINITPAVQAWLNGTANDGIALVGNSPLNVSFDSKESTTTSHPAELDVVFAGGGTITGVTTANTSGLIGGGTSGTLNLSLLNTCGTGQVLEWSGSAWVCATLRGSTALSSITSPTADTSIATGTFPTTFTEGDFGSSPVTSAFGITDTATSMADDSFDLTVENGNNSFHNPFSTGVTTGGTYFPQLQICNNGSGHVGASLFGNSVTCDTLSTAPFNKVAITDNTGTHTGLAILNNASAETGTMLRLLSATPANGSYNFLTACAGTTAADKICNGTTVAALTAAGAFSVATGVTAPQFCIGSNCITSWPGGGKSGQDTLNLGTAKVPQLAAANRFTGNQTINGSLSATGVVTGSGFSIGDKLFAFGSFLYQNAFDGFAGNATTTGSQNTASGVGALAHNTSGTDNTASGVDALYLNTRGSRNTALGVDAGTTADRSLMTADNNTFVGSNSAASTGIIANATAIGAYAEVTASNALVLGSISGMNHCDVHNSCASTKVGIGTTAPSNVFSIGQGAGQAIGDGWTTYSSRRWKTNIQQLHGALGMVEQLRGVSYNSKATGKREIGVIAEEVGAIVPEIVNYEENGKDARGVDYGRLTALLIEGAKEQQRELRQQQAELNEALRQVKRQQSLLRGQTSAMRSLEAEVHEARETLRKVKTQVAASEPTAVAAK